MGTRSVVAVPDGDTWKGRYVHWDGYPTWMGSMLWTLQRDGLETVRKTLTQDYYGWSTLNGDAEQQLSIEHPDGRFVGVPNYGIAYTTQENQSSPDSWVTQFGDSMGTEWAYVLGDADLFCYVYSSGTWKPVECASWDGPEPNWEAWENHGYGK